MPSRPQLEEAICDIGRRLYARGLVAATEGNISARMPFDQVLCTPTLICKGLMKPRDLCLVRLDGSQVSVGRRRSSEVLLHLELYRANPAIQAVIHCHPPHVTAISVAQQPVVPGVLPEAELFLGDVPILDYATPGSAELARLAAPVAATAVCAILKNHGAVAWGNSLEQALWRAEILEAYCRVLYLARALGPMDVLTQSEREKLRALRANFDSPAR